MSQNTCSISGCRKVHYGRGWCAAHYMRWRRHGDPLGGGTNIGDPEKFFSESVLTHTGDDCLIWPFLKSINGYAQMKHCGKKKIVSRRVCEEIKGPPPTPKHEAAHECGNGHLGCVSPNHLNWKTASENQMDRVSHGTSNRGKRQWLCKLDEDSVREIKVLKGIEPYRKIAERFGVSYGAINGIFRGNSWAYLETENAKS